jgi:hypothetical protein
MTDKSSFTEEEWETVLEGPASAGLLVSIAQRGGTFRESFSIAKAYTEARSRHGESELLDEIASSRPKVDRGGRGSAEELKAHHLKLLGEAFGLVQAKAAPEEAEAYRSFVLGLAERVAAAKEEEDGEPVSDAERAMIDEVAATLGGRPG